MKKAQKKTKPLHSRTDPFYSRMKPINKKFLYEQMNREGFHSMAHWFDQLVAKWRKKFEAKKK